MRVCVYACVRVVIDAHEQCTHSVNSINQLGPDQAKSWIVYKRYYT